MTPELYRWEVTYHGGEVRHFVAPEVVSASQLADPWGVLFHVDRKERITGVTFAEAPL